MVSIFVLLVGCCCYFFFFFISRSLTESLLKFDASSGISTTKTMAAAAAMSVALTIHEKNPLCNTYLFWFEVLFFTCNWFSYSCSLSVYWPRREDVKTTTTAHTDVNIDATVLDQRCHNYILSRNLISDFTINGYLSNNICVVIVVQVQWRRRWIEVQKLKL